MNSCVILTSKSKSMSIDFLIVSTSTFTVVTLTNLDAYEFYDVEQRSEVMSYHSPKTYSLLRIILSFQQTQKVRQRMCLIPD